LLACHCGWVLLGRLWSSAEADFCFCWRVTAGGCSAGQAVDAAEAEMAEAFLRGDVMGRPPSAPAATEPGRHIVPCPGAPGCFLEL